MIYHSKDEYISRVIKPALREYAADHNVDDIADQMLIWHDEFNDQGQILLNKSGFVEDLEQDFWEVVEANDK